MEDVKYLAILLLAGCGPTIALNFNTPLPNLQTVNTGNPNCQFDCTQSHTATQSIGPGDVTGATVKNTNTRTESTSIGAPN